MDVISNEHIEDNQIAFKNEGCPTYEAFEEMFTCSEEGIFSTEFSSRFQELAIKADWNIDNKIKELCGESYNLDSVLNDLLYFVSDLYDPEEEPQLEPIASEKPPISDVTRNEQTFDGGLSEANCQKIGDLIREFTLEQTHLGSTDWESIERIIKNIKTGQYNDTENFREPSVKEVSNALPKQRENNWLRATNINFDKAHNFDGVKVNVVTPSVIHAHPPSELKPPAECTNPNVNIVPLQPVPPVLPLEASSKFNTGPILLAKVPPIPVFNSVVAPSSLTSPVKVLPSNNSIIGGNPSPMSPVELPNVVTIAPMPGVNNTVPEPVPAERPESIMPVVLKPKVAEKLTPSPSGKLMSACDEIISTLLNSRKQELTMPVRPTIRDGFVIDAENLPNPDNDVAEAKTEGTGKMIDLRDIANVKRIAKNIDIHSIKEESVKSEPLPGPTNARQKISPEELVEEDILKLSSVEDLERVSSKLLKKKLHLLKKELKTYMNKEPKKESKKSKKGKSKEGKKEKTKTPVSFKISCSAKQFSKKPKGEISGSENHEFEVQFEEMALKIREKSNKGRLEVEKEETSGDRDKLITSTENNKNEERKMKLFASLRVEKEKKMKRRSKDEDREEKKVESLQTFGERNEIFDSIKLSQEEALKRKRKVRDTKEDRREKMSPCREQGRNKYFFHLKHESPPPTKEPQYQCSPERRRRREIKERRDARGERRMLKHSPSPPRRSKRSTSTDKEVQSRDRYSERSSSSVDKELHSREHWCERTTPINKEVRPRERWDVHQRQRREHWMDRSPSPRERQRRSCWEEGKDRGRSRSPNTSKRSLPSPHRHPNSRQFWRQPRPIIVPASWHALSRGAYPH